MDDGTARIQAARWVIGLGRLYGGLLLCATLWSLPAVVFLGSAAPLLMTLTLAALAAVWWALVRAYEQHRRGGWRLLVVVAAVGLLWPVAGALTGDPATVLDSLSIVVNGVLLALLLHPDSRDWVAVDAPRPVAGRPAAHPGGGD